MARIVGVDLPKNKRGEIGLTYIYGIGRSTARAILDKAQVSYDVKVQDWSDENVAAIRSAIAEGGYKVEGERVPAKGERKRWLIRKKQRSNLRELWQRKQDQLRRKWLRWAFKGWHTYTLLSTT